MNEMLYAGIAAEMHRNEALRKAENHRLLRSLKQAARKTDALRDEQIPLSWSQNLAAEAHS